MNSNEIVIYEDNLDLLTRICEAAARAAASGPAFRPPETVALTKNKTLEIRKVAGLFGLEIVSDNLAVLPGRLYDEDDYYD